jgi:RHS repeat-associated protein
MEKCRSKSIAAILFLAVIILVFPAASFAQGQSVFGPKDFRVGMMHFHLSVHPFNVEGGGDGVILVTKKTPEKEFEGGFLLINSQIIALHDFLEGKNQSTERKASLRSRNFLTVFLRGTPGATISIEVRKGVGTPTPQIEFQALPQSINLGETSTLQWTTTNADRITIDQGIGDVAANGAVAVSPKETTTYTLTATGKGGTTTGSATVRVIVPAPTVRLTVNPQTVIQGAPATLTWSSTLADTVSIQPGIGPVSASGSLTVSPSQTTTYILTAIGRGGTVNASATLTVLPPPTVTLGASPQTIIAGASTTLSWTSASATTATIEPGIGNVSPSGSLTINPLQTTTFTITVTGPGGSASASVTVTVHQPPTVTLSANPQTVILGASSTLSWSSTYADTATIDSGIGSVSPNGSLQIAPQTTTSYTITVNGPGGSSASSVTVTVLHPPEVQFSAEPQTILAGAPATLSWNSKNAGAATIDPGIGSVPLSGTLQVYPSETTSYVITVSGPGGSAQSSATVTVLYPPTVRISANPGTILKGEFSDLFWSSTYAESAIIEPGVGPVTLSGSVSVNPSESTTYTITVNGPGGTAAASARIVVEDPLAPPMVAISANPLAVARGSVSTLSWFSTNAQSAHLDNGIGVVPTAGELDVLPGHTATYTITVVGPTGVANSQITVMVTGNPERQPEGSFGSRYEDLVPQDATLEKYDPRRFCVVTGLVQDAQGAPVVGASVRVLHHPEYGTSLTDSEGRFSMPAEGGGILTLVYHRRGLITAHRKVNAPWNDTVMAETVKMIAEDDAATVVTFNGNADDVTSHQSSLISDSFGERSCTMIFKGDNKAYAVDEYGNDIGELSTITVRATEFATPETMPAILPPTSAYTYCADLKVNGAEKVRFQSPVTVYVNNFLGFKVGEIVPAGYYDRDRGVWVPTSNGTVVRLVDVNGDGKVDAIDKGNGAPLEPAEGLEDPNAYLPGSTFWRIQVSHFTPWDFNWPYIPPVDSIPPNPEGIALASQQLEEQRDCRVSAASFIEERSGILHEDIPLPGTGVTLHYASNRVKGYKTLIEVPASGATVPPSLKEIIVQIRIAGRSYEKTLPPEPYQKDEILWDGLDHLGREVVNLIKAQVNIGFVYDAVYLSPLNRPNGFGLAGLRWANVPARQDYIFWTPSEVTIEPKRGKQSNIGEGWDLSSHHSSDPTAPNILHKGNGSILKNNSILINTVAGNGQDGFSGDGGPATQAKLGDPFHITVDAAGNIYINEYYNHRVRKVTANGIITTVAGTGIRGYSGDGGPATLARLNYPWSTAVDEAGSLYITDLENRRIRKVDTNGIITTIAGTGAWGYWYDGYVAKSSPLSNVKDIVVDAEGNIYFTEDDWVGKIDTNGILSTFAGWYPGYSGDGGPATEADFDYPYGLALDKQGNVYIADTVNCRVRKVNKSGIVTTVAGNGSCDHSGDGGRATEAGLEWPFEVAVDSAGNLYIVDSEVDRIRKVDTNGIITTVAGGEGSDYSGDGGPATMASLDWPNSVAVDRTGDIYIADTYNWRIRKVGPPATFAELVALGEIPFVEEKGIAHIISSAGLHKTTIDVETGMSLYEFGYDQNKNLTFITDQFGNSTIIRRDGGGVPYEIVSPDGLVTSLIIDPSNHLTRITYPDGSFYSFEYTEEGLLTAKMEPEGNRFEHEFDEAGRLTDAFDENGGHWSFLRYRDDRGDVHVDTLTAEGTATSYLDRNKSTGAYSSMIMDSFGTVTSYDQSPDGLEVSKALSCGMELNFKYDLDPAYGFKYLNEMAEKSPSGLLKVTQKQKTYQDTNADMIPDLITETTSINGKTTMVEHDVLQALKTLTSPQGRRTTAFYDPDNLLTSRLSFPGLYDTTFDYDQKGRLTSVLINTRETTFTYDSRGFLNSVTDPENRTTTYTHDLVGRVWSISRPDGSSLEFSYDKNGNMTVLSNPAAVDHAFSYNTVNLNGSYTTPLSGVYQYLYDKDRRLKQTTFPSGATIRNQYDRERLMQILTPEGSIDFSYLCGTKVGSITKGSEKVSYTYDGSLLASEALTGTLGKTLSYAYDNDFNLKSFSYAGSTTSYTYDNDGLLTGSGSLAITRDVQNGLPTDISGGRFSLTRSFNGYGEISGQNVSISETPMNTWNLIRNDNGRIIEKTEVIGGTTNAYVYQYDTMGRLVRVAKDGAVIEQYQYDPTGTGTRVYEVNTLRGISGRTFAYSVEDHLLTAGTRRYQYNPDGYLMSRTDGTSVTSYTYSSRGELLKVTSPDGNVIEYVCDPLWRRIAKKVNGEFREKYLWQGMTRLLAVYDGSDNLLMRFEYADDRVPVALTRGGAVYYLAHDQVGSLRAVVDGAGNIVKRIDYDSFGNILYDSNPSFSMPFGFAGGLHDRDTGLVRFGFRDYDPDIGRWTAKDPIFFAGGDSDLYGYCVNDPIDLIDQEGSWAQLALAAEWILVRGHILYQRAAPHIARAVSGAWAYGRNAASSALSWIKRLSGKPHPTKLNHGCKQQPYDPETGRYLSYEANPGFESSPVSHFSIGLSQGFSSAMSGAEIPPAVSTAQAWGQNIGNLAGSIAGYLVQ